jgi:hypothetical protein
VVEHIRVAVLEIQCRGSASSDGRPYRDTWQFTRVRSRQTVDWVSSKARATLDPRARYHLMSVACGRQGRCPACSAKVPLWDGSHFPLVAFNDRDGPITRN